jgi:hypothetical protein
VQGGREADADDANATNDRATATLEMSAVLRATEPIFFTPPPDMATQSSDLPNV